MAAVDKCIFMSAKIEYDTDEVGVVYTLKYEACCSLQDAVGNDTLILTQYKNRIVTQAHEIVRSELQ